MKTITANDVAKPLMRILMMTTPAYVMIVGVTQMEMGIQTQNQETMTESTEEYNEEHPASINRRLNRLSIKKIKEMGEHWEELYG